MLNFRIGRVEIEGKQGALILVALLIALSAIRLGSWGGLAGAALLIVSLLWHEVGHLAMAQALGVPVKAIGLCLKGAYLRRSESLKPASELLIAAAGPAANFLLYLWFRDGDLVLRWVALLNLVLAVSNLIPLKGTDGARICRSLRRLWAPSNALSAENQA